jgi:hypothetical protein
MYFYGMLIPSIPSMCAIKDYFSDEESFLTFLEKNEKWCKFQKHKTDFVKKPEMFFFSDNALPLIANSEYLSLVELIEVGFDAESITLYRQCTLIKDWHECVRNNFTGGNRQRNKRSMSGIMKHLDGKKKFENLDLYPKLCYEELLDHHNFESCQLAMEYLEACDYVASLNHAKVMKIKHSNGTKYSYREKLENVKKLMDTMEKHPTTTYQFLCSFCKKYSKVNGGKTPTDCGSAQCKKEYKQKWEKGNRPPQPTRASAGWEVAFDGNRRDCQSCGEKRQVNEERICFDCYCHQNNINPKTSSK